LLYMI